MQDRERADFHGHPLLNPSYDRQFGLEKYVRYAREKGISIPPITNFGEEKRFEVFYEDPIPRSWEKEQFDQGFIVYADGRRLTFFRSNEVPTKDGHLLVVGVPRNLAVGRSLVNTLQEARDLGALIIADHPLSPRISGGMGEHNVLRHWYSFDALELNPNATKKENDATYRLATELNIPLVANSDLHMSYQPWLPYFRGRIEDSKFGHWYNSFTLSGQEPSKWIGEIKKAISERETEYSHDKGHSRLWVFRTHIIPISVSILKDKATGRQGRPN